MSNDLSSKELVTRLRRGEACGEAGNLCRSMDANAGCICAQAADEIERLQQKLWAVADLIFTNDRDGAKHWASGIRVSIKRDGIDVSTTHEPSAELYAEVIRLREEVKGPDGFATWKDAAVSERVKRVELERRISEPPAVTHAKCGCGDPSCPSMDDERVLQEVENVLVSAHVVWPCEEGKPHIQRTLRKFREWRKDGLTPSPTKESAPCYTCGGHGRIDEIRIGNLVNVPCPECTSGETSGGRDA